MPTTGSADQGARLLGQIIAFAITFIAAVHFALFGYFLYRTAIISPISDMFTYIADYLRFRAGQVGLLSYLWQPHGEHRLVWVRLLTWLDVELLHTRGFAFMSAATASITTTTALLWYRMRRDEPMLPVSLTLLAPMLVLTSANVVDCSVPINTTYPMTIVFAVLSIVLFADAGARNRRPTLQRAAAIVAAIGASFATAAGLLVWPILVWIGWHGRTPHAWLAGVAAIGCVYVIFYLHNLPPYGLAPALEMDAGSYLSPGHVWKVLDYFIGFLGLPLTREPTLAVPGRVIGIAFVLVGLSAVAVVSFRFRPLKPLDQIAVGLIMLALGSAALAAVGRSELVSEIPVRYTIFTSMLHVGLLYLLLSRFAHLFAASPGQLSLKIAALGIAAALLIQQVMIGRIAERTAAIIAQDADCFAEGNVTGPINPAVTRTPAGSSTVIGALRQQGLLTPRSTRCISP